MWSEASLSRIQEEVLLAAKEDVPTKRALVIRGSEEHEASFLKKSQEMFVLTGGEFGRNKGISIRVRITVAT